MALIKLNTRSIPDNAVTPAKVSQNLGRRNMIINGAMQVSQRATSVTGITSGNNWTADRFAFNTGTNGGTYTLSTTTTVPSGEGFEKSLKIDCTTAGNYSTAGTSTMLRCSPFEIQDCARLAYGTSGAKKLTVSFWTRASYIGTFTALLVTHDSAQRNIIKTFTIASANTWQKVVLTYDGDTGSTFTGADNALGLSLDIWMGGGSSYTGGSQTDGVWRARSTHNTSVLQGNGTLFGTSTSHDFYITGVQIEVGDTATDFEHRSYGEELTACQRYYENDGMSGGDNYRVAISKPQTSDAYYFHIPYKTLKRTKATITITSAYSDNLVLNVHGASSGVGGFGTASTTGGSADNRALYEFFWKADAEL